MGKGCKKEEARGRKGGYYWTEDTHKEKYGRRIGATGRIGTEKWRGRQGLQKGESTGTEAHTRKVWKTHRSNGTNWNGEMEGGGKDCKKEKTPEQRTHTRKARKMHKKPHMKTPHIY